MYKQYFQFHKNNGGKEYKSIQSWLLHFEKIINSPENFQKRFTTMVQGMRYVSYEVIQEKLVVLSEQKGWNEIWQNCTKPCSIQIGHEESVLFDNI